MIQISMNNQKREQHLKIEDIESKPYSNQTSSGLSKLRGKLEK